MRFFLPFMLALPGKLSANWIRSQRGARLPCAQHTLPDLSDSLKGSCGTPYLVKTKHFAPPGQEHLDTSRPREFHLVTETTLIDTETLSQRLVRCGHGAIEGTDSDVKGLVDSQELPLTCTSQWVSQELEFSASQMQKVHDPSRRITTDPEAMTLS